MNSEKRDTRMTKSATMRVIKDMAMCVVMLFGAMMFACAIVGVTPWDFVWSL